MFLLSNGHILSNLDFWMFFIPTIFILSHVVLLIIIIPQWLIDGYFDPKGRKQIEKVVLKKARVLFQ